MNSTDDLPAISPQLRDIPGWRNTTGFEIKVKNHTLPFDRNYSIVIEGKNSAGRVLLPELRLSKPYVNS